MMKIPSIGFSSFALMSSAKNGGRWIMKLGNTMNLYGRHNKMRLWTTTNASDSNIAVPSAPTSPARWQFQELVTVIGKDYTSINEVQVYDATHAVFRDITDECRHVLDDLFQVQPGQTLVDFGCGTGTCVLEAAKRGLQVHGVDVSLEMLRMAQTKLRDFIGGASDDESSSLSSRVQFHHSGFLTYTHHPISEKGKKGEVDFVTTTYALHHLPDLWKQVALQRIHSMLLKPGGKLHIRDVVLKTNEEEPQYDVSPVQRITDFVQQQSDLGKQANDNGFLKQDAEQHFREEFSTYDWVLEGMLQRAGFEIVYKDFDATGVIGTYVCKAAVN